MVTTRKIATLRGINIGNIRIEQISRDEIR